MNTLKIHPAIEACLRDQVAPGTGISPEQFWNSFAECVHALGPKNLAALQKRNSLQKKIDDYHMSNPGPITNEQAYKQFLQEIGYLLPEPEGDCTVQTTNIDPEISTIAGPQLVVPGDNARFALNAANARWGSLYDGLYGTNVIGEEDGASKQGAYNPIRGQRVFDYTHAFLDEIAPLASGRFWSETKSFVIESNGVLSVMVEGSEGSEGSKGGSSVVPVQLQSPSQFVASSGDVATKGDIVLLHHDLHVIINVDRTDSVGSTHPGGFSDVTLEAAVSTIIDFEDSVSAVDGEDKAKLYANFAGLMKGDLQWDMGGGRAPRTLRPDKKYGHLTLQGRSLMLCRNVGMHMYTDAVQIKSITTGNWEDVPEGMLDCWFSTLAAMHDLAKSGVTSSTSSTSSTATTTTTTTSTIRNSREGSFYIVKPKMHGPEEVALTVEVMARVEMAFGLPARTVKIGIMDEERRTTVNLKRCIQEARHRLIFINTGFLDRTGDEIHTSMRAGAVVPKKMIAVAEWRKAYEDWNVDVGMETELVGKGQIGKGMWAEPDDMSGLLASKGNHPRMGATCAWVPSPTAATLHAIHYHMNSVSSAQSRIRSMRRRTTASLDSILRAPIATSTLSTKDVKNELDECAQLILGYVVRWVEFGVGCSKVPDLNNVGKMEDRATLRISSQLLSNWLHHQVITLDQLKGAFTKWASVVDGQNASDAQYRPMCADLEGSISFSAGVDLCTQGMSLPNGYTESILHAARRSEKKKLKTSKM